MSVRTGDRSEGTLGVLNEVRKLGEYTIQICKSEKVFPKSSRWVMAKPIIDECIAALTCVRRANAVYVQPETAQADYDYRRSEQVRAHSHLDAMLSLIDLAYTSFAIESGRIEYWTGLVLKADDKLKSWMKSDKQRYTKPIGQ
jgi:hypothetical protein